MSTPYNKNLKTKQQKRGSRRKRWVLAVVAVIILMAGGCLAYRHHHHKKIIAVTASQDTKGEVTTTTNPANTTNNTSSSTSQSSTPGSQPGDNKANTGGTNPAPTTTLTAPTGVLVSTHHANLNGSPAPNQLNSNCSTVSGATCQIIFTKDGVTKSLPAQVTDRGGSTYWNSWKLQDVGLTVGQWHVQAKATLGSQVATYDDAMNLDVQP